MILHLFSSDLGLIQRTGKTQCEYITQVVGRGWRADVCFTCCRSLQVPLRGAKRQQKTKGSCSYGRHALEEFIFPIFPVTAFSVFAIPDNLQTKLFTGNH